MQCLLCLVGDMINPFSVNRLIVLTIVFVYPHEKTLNFWGTGEPLVYRISIETLTFKSFLKNLSILIRYLVTY